MYMQHFPVTDNLMVVAQLIYICTHGISWIKLQLNSLFIPTKLFLNLNEFCWSAVFKKSKPTNFVKTCRKFRLYGIVEHPGMNYYLLLALWRSQHALNSKLSEYNFFNIHTALNCNIKLLGAPPFIFLIFNKTIRNDVDRIFREINRQLTITINSRIL